MLQAIVTLKISDKNKATSKYFLLLLNLADIFFEYGNVMKLKAKQLSIVNTVMVNIP